MTALLLAMTVFLPLLLSCGYAWAPARRYLLASLPLAALPGLVLALVGSEQALTLPWLLEGTAWGLDEVRRTFLAFTSLLWVVSGLYACFYFGADDRPEHFALFWLLTLSGNLGLIVGLDIASFYTFFALMTLAAYGLIVHNRDSPALRAGRVYMVMALAGEMALLAGLIMAAAPERLLMLEDIPGAVLNSSYQNAIMALLVTGFGVKAGVVLLHLWLPLAHPAAPTPASAVLSGAMIKAGLFGWLFTLPFGQEALTTWAMVLIGAGLAAAFGGALVGVCQTIPKAVLAYSSISQMGLMTVLVGFALASPDAWPAALPALALYAMHHGLAKGALFLSAGTVEHAGAWPRAITALLAWLPALSLTGLVLTSGAAGKGAFKEVLHAHELPLAIGPWLEPLINAGAVATTLLVARYLWCLHPQWNTGRNNPGLLGSWALACLSSLVAFWWLPMPSALPKLTTGLGEPLGYLWPLALGLVVAGLALTLGLRRLPIPAGDLLQPIAQLGRQGGRVLAAVIRGLGLLQKRVIDASRHGLLSLLDQSGRLLAAEPHLIARAGLLFLGLLLLALALLIGALLVWN